MKVIKYTDQDINTDVIWPGKYTYVQIPLAEMKNYAMETFDPNFKEKVQDKEVLVVGKNFGCGSSREQASECLKQSGIRFIIAPSFARIFYRNSINVGLPVIESQEAFNAINDGDLVEVDLEKGEIQLVNRVITFPPFPKFVLDLINKGGLINSIKK